MSFLLNFFRVFDGFGIGVLGVLGNLKIWDKGIESSSSEDESPASID